MKILFPIGTFYPAQLGGPNNSVFAIAKELVKQNHEVYVLTTTLGIKREHKIKANEWNLVEGINVFYANSSFFSKSFPKINKKLLKNILKQCDIVHLTAVFTPFSHSVAKICREFKIPYVWSPRGELKDYTIKMKRLKKKFFLYLPFVKNNLKSSFFHVTSKEEEKELIKNMSKYCNIILNQEDVFEIPNISDEKIFKKSLTKQNYNEKKYILFLGRISIVKNIESLIKAYYHFSLKDQIQLLIAGDTSESPEYYKKLQNLIKKLNLSSKVLFTKKRIEGEEKISLYKNAELFILPSHSENFGMVVLESLAQGTPVISTKNTPWESLEKQNCGFWVEKDENSLKNAIEQYFSKTEIDKEKMKKNAIDLSKTFSAKKLIDKYIEMYDLILKKGIK